MSVLRRALDRWWGMLIVLAIPIFIWLSPVLVGGMLIAEEPFWYHIPLYTFYKNAIASGDSFLWNPYNFSGFPSFVSVVGFFSPIHYLAFRFFPVMDAFHWLLFADFVLAAFFTALLLRDFGVSALGQYLGALGYVSANLVYTNALTMANAVLFLPLFFWALSRIRGGGWRYAVLASAVLGWAWLSGVTQYVLYGVIAAVAFMLFIVWQAERSLRSRLLIKFLLILLAGTAIGMVQLTPTALIARESVRSGGLSYAEASIDPLLPSDALRLFLPYFEPPFGVPFGSKGAEAFVYLGAIPFFFLLAAFGSKSSPARFFKWLFIGAGALAIVYSPFYWLLAKAPVFNLLRGQSRWMIAGFFAAAVLVGFGADRFRSTPQARSNRLLVSLFAIASLAVTLAAVAMPLAAGTLTDVAERFAGSADLASRVVAELGRTMDISRPEVFLPLIAALVASLLLVLISRRPELVRQAAGWLAIFAGLNFIAIAPLSYPAAPRQVIADPPPTVRFLTERDGRAFNFLTDTYVDEVVGRLPSPTNRGLVERLQAAAIFPNTNLFYGIASAGYFEQIRSKNMSRLLNLLGDPYTGSSDLRGLSTREGQVRLFERRKGLVDFLGIRWVVSGWPLDEEKFPKVFTATVTDKKIPLSVYENRESKPFTYLAPQVRFVVGDDEEAFRVFAEGNFSELVVRCGPGCTPGVRSFGRGSVTRIDQGNAKLTLALSLNEPGFLVVSQNNLPGWRATIDGREVPIQTVNTVFMGIPVPAGEHDIALEYSFRRLVALIALHLR